MPDEKKHIEDRVTRLELAFDRVVPSNLGDILELVASSCSSNSNSNSQFIAQPDFVAQRPTTPAGS